MGFDVEALLRAHLWTAAIGVAAALGCLAVLARACERARALAETSAALSRARAGLEGRRAAAALLLPRLDAIDSRLRALQRRVLGPGA